MFTLDINDKPNLYTWVPPDKNDDIIVEEEPNSIKFKVHLDANEIRLKDHYFRRFNNKSTKKNILKNYQYIRLAKSELRKAGLPDEYALMMLVESELNPKCYYQGTHGLWQLCYPTAKIYGAKSIDDLYCPVKSTKIAVQYIKYLHKKFNGNHRLVVYGYNVGDGKIGRLVKMYGGRIPSNALPSITSAYIPKMMAYKEILKKEKKKK